MNKLNIVVAYEIHHARHFAEVEKQWARKDYKIVLNQTDYLRGLVNVTVWVLEAPWFHPTPYQLHQRQIMEYVLKPQLHRIKVERVTLP